MREAHSLLAVIADEKRRREGLLPLDVT